MDSEQVSWFNRYVIAMGPTYEHELGEEVAAPDWAVKRVPPTWGEFHGTSGYFVGLEGNELPKPDWWVALFSEH